MDTPTIYCEQISYNAPQIFNIASSFAFVLVAFFAFIKLRKEKSELATVPMLLLILLTLLGFGSATWHITSTSWSDVLDSTVITGFVLVSLLSTVSKVKLSAWVKTGLIFIITLAAYRFELLSAFNNSAVYLFFLLLMALVAIYFRKVNQTASNYFLKAGILLSGGIVARTFDPILCSSFPIGTHFLWHILVAASGYFVVMAVDSLYNKRKRHEV